MKPATEWVKIPCECCVSTVPDPECKKCEGTGVLYRREYWVGGGKNMPLIRVRDNNPHKTHEVKSSIDTPWGTFDAYGKVMP